MKKQRPLTVLELALMGLVHQEPRSGYELKKIFETTPMAHCSSSPGAIYPALKRLEERGLLDGKVEKAGSMRPRRRFRVSKRGLETLNDWVARPVSHEDLVWRIDELILRFGFMGQLADTDVVCRFLEQMSTGIDALVEGLETHHATMGDDTLPAGVLPTGRLALGNGIRSYREMANWARDALREIKEFNS